MKIGRNYAKRGQSCIDKIEKARELRQSRLNNRKSTFEEERIKIQKRREKLQDSNNKFQVLGIDPLNEPDER